MFLETLVIVLSAAPALAYTRGEVSGGASVEPATIALGETARFVGEMCNDGPRYVGGTAFLGTFIPLDVGYRVVGAPAAGVCHAVRSSSYNYVYCTVALRPGTCDQVDIDVTPTVVGDTTLYVLADSANVIRETAELDNRASVVLTTE